MREKLEIVCFSLVIILFFGLFVFADNVDNYYTVKGKVSAIQDDKIIITDITDNTWEFYGDDFQVDDKIVIKFFTNGTDNTRTDDEVIEVEKI